ncbi:predicted protein [Nematostella vectensis]|uniref:FAM20 C-terminal domain-containing protein n=1 Tax=Nematostella vectensis TaxID=45351 RepID=A7RWD4_NEMVE|nr:predicted protein [Nematostella vectensis]|eukprot:XP_001636304.1 predicted protein [Nematostella vectensis]
MKLKDRLIFLACVIVLLVEARSENIDSKNNNDNDDDDDNDIEGDDPWQLWKDMVTSRHLTPSGKQEVNLILDALSYKPIVAAGVGYKGTQLKATLLLEGNQKVVFKPGRYSREHVIKGKPYDGYDRHNGEIAAFHLDRVLGFNRAPPVAGRVVDLQDEIEPIAERNLLHTFFKKGGNTCFYGVCYYCNKEEAACANKTSMEGSMTIWLPQGWALRKWRHPWQRTYNNRKASWELDNNHCKKVIQQSPYDQGPRLLDIIDTAVFDFLIGNADRHHYETFKKGDDEGMLVHLDNAKSFGNPDHDELSIAAPLYQCCQLRDSTYKRLKEIANNKVKPVGELLKEATSSDALAPVLTEPHFKAVTRRLSIVMDIVTRCIERNGRRKVIKKDGL